ncbi:MAG: uracil phosphoribosyltransferase [Clostridia bacterium]|nr:uracil phosphoribosyltransferase [Clostridia bacterium]MBR6822657.1 uracil phosphoribosyltransferase [Clostridia bacterium]
MGEVILIDHPMIQHKLTLMRKEETSSKDFRELLEEIAMFMAYEVTRDLPLMPIRIKTPICETEQNIIEGKALVIVPILRAGLGMVSGLHRLVPAAKVGHIGLYRDPKTHKPVEYYCKLPEGISEREVILVDPMLATGGSAVDAITLIKQKGGVNIKFMCLVAAPEGIKAVQDAHPDVNIYTAAIDECLNENAYIVPGLGDAGDRIFGTK